MQPMPPFNDDTPHPTPSANGDRIQDESAPSPDEDKLTASQTEPGAEARAEGDDVQDRRQSPRRKKLLRVILADATATESISAWIVDRSLGGMCLEVDRPIEEGTVVRVRRPTAPVGVPWVDLRVQSVRAEETVWHLGCEFVRTPTWEVLMQFG